VRPALIKHYTENDFPTIGVKGDPSLATAAYGKILLNFKIDAAVRQITAAFK
jgi:creatinine amidohydrolase/Fe(II)-dependent formamide hydrolase-like protein